MDLLQRREQEIFATLAKIKKYHFVVIGGYAVNAYTLPRFSVDCDIVVKNLKESALIERELEKVGYVKEAGSTQSIPYHGSFVRYVKEIGLWCKVSMDILIHEVADRQTSTIFGAAWVFKHSLLRVLRGKTIADQLRLRIIDLDALVVMKFICCRSTDIRDVFMLLPMIPNREALKDEISTHYDFSNRFHKIKEKITSPTFKDGLQGVYGYVDQHTFDKHTKAVLDLEK